MRKSLHASISLALVLTVVALAASGSLAQQSVSPAGQQFGGSGTFGLRGGRVAAGAALTGFSVAPDGVTARIYAAFGGSCGKANYNAWVLAKAPIVAGAINFKTQAQFVEGADVDATATIAAQVAAEGVTGSLRFSARLGHRRCTTRMTPDFVARPLASQSGTGGPLPSSYYRGIVNAPVRRSYVAPVVLVTSDDARRVLVASWTAALRCTRTKGEWWDNYSPSAPIRSDGSFVRNEKFSVEYRGARRESFRTQFAGKFSGSTVGGTLRVRKVVRRHGRVIDRCDSGQLSWSAQP